MSAQTAAATAASVEKRQRSAAERRAVEEFAPSVRLLSETTFCADTTCADLT